MVHPLQMLVGDDDLPAGGGFQPGQQVQQGTFTAAAAPDDAAQLPRRNGKVYPAKRVYIHASYMVDLGHIPQGYDGFLLHPFLHWFHFIPTASVLRRPVNCK